MRFLILLFTFAALLAPLSLLHAQIPNVQDLQQNLTVEVNPEFPKPYSPVEISIASYTYDLNSASIAWSIDDRILAQGIGVKGIEVTTGAVGITQTLTVTIVPLNAPSFSKNINITPTDVTFLTQAMTYTPPLYEGKALFTSEVPALIVAIPQVGPEASIDPSKLIYKWTRNGTVANDASGYGKQSLAIQGNYWGRDENIMVEVSTVGGNIIAKNTLVYHPQSAELVVYENDPLLGLLLNNAQTTTFNLKSSSEASFLAAPFGFDSSLIPQNTYMWKMNEKAASNENGNAITFRNDSGESGTSAVSVTATQPGNDLKSAVANFSIQF